MPVSAMSSIWVSWVREYESFSAVAWVSTRPPSASMTTFMSTVARESSS